MALNRKRMQRLYRTLLKVQRFSQRDVTRRFDMSYWKIESVVRDGPECRTACCALGWYIELEKPQDLTVTVATSYSKPSEEHRFLHSFGANELGCPSRSYDVVGEADETGRPLPFPSSRHFGLTMAENDFLFVCGLTPHYARRSVVSEDHCSVELKELELSQVPIERVIDRVKFLLSADRPADGYSYGQLGEHAVQAAGKDYQYGTQP